MGGGGTLSGKKLSGFSRLRVELKKAILKKSAISVFVLVALWNISVSTNVTARFLEGNGPIVETLREIRDLNLHLQMRSYQAMTSVRPGHLNPGNIRLVYIDDEVHWTNHGGRGATPKKFPGHADRQRIRSSQPGRGYWQRYGTAGAQKLRGGRGRRVAAGRKRCI